jgi:hypothetical protein
MGALTAPAAFQRFGRGGRIEALDQVGFALRGDQHRPAAPLKGGVHALMI